MASLLLMLFGAINWGVYGFLNRNLVNYIPFGWLRKFVYIAMIFSAANLLNRDLLLPFLGKMAFPCGLLQPLEPNEATLEVPIQVPESGDYVVYWAAEPLEEVFETPMSAYQSMENSGIAPVGANSVAVLKLREPSGYQAGGKTIKPHVHYRVCQGGMLSRVYTHYF